MSNDEPKKIGLIIGREWSWPSAFINEVNQRDQGVLAEFVKLGGTSLDKLYEYHVIIDRMSHEIPYYRTVMKHAALQGTYIINNPFAWSADDKFFGLALVRELGLNTLPTTVLPNKRVESHHVPESFRNLEYPMDWKGIIDNVGVPAILKDVHTGSRQFARRVTNVDDLIRTYDESDTRTVLLQPVIDTNEYIHCFVFGQEQARVLAFNREEDNYLEEADFIDDEMEAAIARAAISICRKYGYDMNMSEFIVQDGEIIVINPSNPAPEIDIDQMPADHFKWCVRALADFAIRMAFDPLPQPGWHRD